MKLLPKQALRRKQLAFTLIDVMMGMGVLGVVLLSLFASFTFGFTSIKLFREELKATQILQEKTELLRCYTWSQIMNPKIVSPAFKVDLTSNSPAFYRGTLVISPVAKTNAYSGHLHQIDVTVSWTNNNVRRERATRTFVYEYGIQNYVFNYE